MGAGGRSVGSGVMVQRDLGGFPCPQPSSAIPRGLYCPETGTGFGHKLMMLILIAAKPCTCMDVPEKADPHGYIPALFQWCYNTGLPPVPTAGGTEVSLSCALCPVGTGGILEGRETQPKWATTGTSAQMALPQVRCPSPGSSSRLFGAISHRLTPQANPFPLSIL